MFYFFFFDGYQFYQIITNIIWCRSRILFEPAGSTGKDKPILGDPGACPSGKKLKSGLSDTPVFGLVGYVELPRSAPDHNSDPCGISPFCFTF